MFYLLSLYHLLYFHYCSNELQMKPSKLLLHFIRIQYTFVYSLHYSLLCLFVLILDITNYY